MTKLLGGKEVLRASVDRSEDEVMERTSVQESSPSVSTCLVSMGNTLAVIEFGTVVIVRGMRLLDGIFRFVPLWCIFMAKPCYFSRFQLDGTQAAVDMRCQRYRILKLLGIGAAIVSSCN